MGTTQSKGWDKRLSFKFPLHAIGQRYNQSRSRDHMDLTRTSRNSVVVVLGPPTDSTHDVIGRPEFGLSGSQANEGFLDDPGCKLNLLPLVESGFRG